MHLDAEREKNALRVLVFDLEPIAVRHAAGEPFAREGAAIVEPTFLRDSVVLDDVCEGEPNQLLVLRPVDAMREHHSRIEILESDHQGTPDGAVRPFHEDIELVAVGVDRLHRVPVILGAALMRMQALRGLAALARQRSRHARKLFLDAALQCFLVRNRRPAMLFRRTHHPPIAGLESRLLGAQIIGDEAIPGARVAFGRDRAADMARREMWQTVGAIDAFDQSQPAPQGR